MSFSLMSSISKYGIFNSVQSIPIEFFVSITGAGTYTSSSITYNTIQ